MEKTRAMKNVLTVYEEKLRKDRHATVKARLTLFSPSTNGHGNGKNTSVLQHYTNCSAFDCGDEWVPKSTKQVDAKSVEGGYERVE